MKESLTEVSKEEVQSLPIDGFVQIYDSLESSWARAPCRYINFIKTYFSIVNNKKEALTKRQNMLSVRQCHENLLVKLNLLNVN